MSVINTNIKALYTQNALLRTERAQSEAMQQLSTGKRINSARDDAAGLAISQRMTQQIRSLDMAVKNAGDAISLIQTAEGATASITDMLQRMRELAVQSANATNANDQRGYLDLEFQQLKQQIQSIADQTQWNGFSILNGTAGEAVGTRPVYKVTSEAKFSEGVSHSVASASTANTGTLTYTGTGTLAKAGTLNITSVTATAATATLTLPDGTQHSLTGVADATNKTITFSNTALTDGSGTFVITSTTVGSTTAQAFTGQTVTLNLSRSLPTQPTGMANDVIINGVTIPMTSTTEDKFSTGSLSASTIAKVAAINQMTPDTKVFAVANPTVMSGAAMSGADVVKGTVTINGFTTELFSTSQNNLRESRTTVVNAINAISAQTGVVAINNDSDARGISLVAADGRNIEVVFNTADSSANFSARTGLKQGLQTGSFSLESAVEGPIVVTSTGNWQNAGLPPGNYSTNISSFVSVPRPVVSSASAIEALGDGDLVINGFAIRGAVANDDTRSSTTALTSSRAGSAIAIAAAINERSADTGVKAIASPAVTLASAGPSTTASASPANLFINGVNVQITLTAGETSTDRLNNIITAINRQQGMHGVQASKTADGRLQLETLDGRNMSVWYDNGVAPPAAGLGAQLGLTGTAATHISGATTASTGAATSYGTVRLESDKPITLTPGNNGFTSEGDFSSLGFQEGTFGGEVDDALSKLTPPRTGRLTFHVGAAASQVISIDLADYGSKGPITSEITGDVDVTDPTKRINRIDTVDSATGMLSKLDTVLDRVNANRATMGAVMNRLDYVMDNLSNVSTNTEASRSQIEDADYAKASTALAKTQIMQQAATAVLAQANQSLQTVLKLLQ
jgi:flagellin